MVPSDQALVGMAALAVVGLVAFTVYRWQQRGRVRQIEQWIKEYLVGRYSVLPGDLHINCSDDKLWPVLVDFHDPLTGARHRLQFASPRLRSDLSLLSEKVDAPSPGVAVSEPSLATEMAALAG